MSSLREGAARLVVPLHQNLDDIAALLPEAHRAEQAVRRESTRCIWRVVNTFPYLLTMSARQDPSTPARAFAADIAQMLSQLQSARESAETRPLFLASVYALDLALSSGAWLALWSASRGAGPEAAPLAEDFSRLSRRLELLDGRGWPMSSFLDLLRGASERSIAAVQLAVSLPDAPPQAPSLHLFQ